MKINCDVETKNRPKGFLGRVCSWVALLSLVVGCVNAFYLFGFLKGVGVITIAVILWLVGFSALGLVRGSVKITRSSDKDGSERV